MSHSLLLVKRKIHEYEREKDGDTDTTADCTRLVQRTQRQKDSALLRLTSVVRGEARGGGRREAGGQKPAALDAVRYSGMRSAKCCGDSR